MRRIAPYDFKVNSMDIGFQETIRFVKMGGYMLDAAGKNAMENGFGVTVLKNESLAWVLSRFAVEMYRYPKNQEPFVIETWIESLGRVFTTRNFKMTDGDGSLIGAGSSIWCLLDLETRKATDLTMKPEYKDFETGIPPLMEGPSKVPSVTGDPISRHRIKYSDIDFNHHTNSMKYLEWMIDLFPMEIYLNKQVRRVDINYVNEALFGDVIDIRRDSPKPDQHVFDLRRGDDVICKARIMF